MPIVAERTESIGDKCDLGYGNYTAFTGLCRATLLILEKVYLLRQTHRCKPSSALISFPFTDLESISRVEMPQPTGLHLLPLGFLLSNLLSNSPYFT